MKYAFRCKNCGRLETSDQAAECSHPHACRVCGDGIRYDSRTGKKTPMLGDNWEVLADASPGRLAEIGLSPDQVEKHKHWPKKSPGREPQQLSLTANESTASAD
jgi:hypothetical protein